MKKHELLVPVGNMECLKQAVFNGCDAVYLGCKKYGARKYAKNFSDDEIIKAIKFCHLYGVSVYVTMNTLVKENEVEDFINQARFLHKNGVDALIVQDFGMICLLRKMFPNLELHASTQANISSKETCKLYYDLGVKRVVFARELSLEEIDSIDVPIEKEAFIHGALCIAYSGGCLMSSMLGGRSGNRGECAGVCRMPFSLWLKNKKIGEQKYLLSTKELNTSKYIDILLASTIYSFKIEGRMKGPHYVGFITRFYRKLLDNEEISISEYESKLMTIYNRLFTKGRIFKATDEELMNTTSPNHQGLKIGIASPKNNKIKIELTDKNTLHQYDAIRFLNKKEGFIVNYLYDENKNLISSSTTTAYVDNKIELNSNDTVFKTKDYLLEKDIENTPQKRIPVSFMVKAKQNKELEIKINDDNNNSIIENGNIIEQAKNIPTTINTIHKQLNRLNETPFILNNIDIEMDDDIFIPIKELNEIRRRLVLKLIEKRENYKKSSFIEKKVSLKKKISDAANVKISATVYNREQLNTCLELKVPRIYVRNRALYQEYSNKESIYYYAKRFPLSMIDNIESKTLVSDYSFFTDKNIVGNYSLNVTNSYTAYFLNNIGYHAICISAELSEDEKNILKNNYYDKFGDISLETVTYGRIENMVIKGNILNLQENNYEYYLLDSKSKKFPVYYDGEKTHIMNYEKINDNNKNYNNTITARLDFYDETSEEIKSIVKKYQ